MLANEKTGALRALPVLLGLVLLGLSLPSALHAQFGRNKVQYETFDFRVLHTQHYDIHFYPEAELAVRDAARMAERWNQRLSRVFNHQLSSVKPVILYANHPDFQQTNVLRGLIGEGTGGVTESLKDRVIMPLAGAYRDTDHVLGHELVHSYQYDIAEKLGALNQRGIGQLPGWLVEGMAEYLSVGREDPHTAMWLRDAALRGDLPTIRQLTLDPRFFPYRYGQALWAYIGGRWGDRAVTELFHSSLRDGWQLALRRHLRMTEDELSREWMTAIREAYLPLIQGRVRPEAIATKVLAEEIDAGDINVGPALSPDGRYVAFYSERDIFDISLFLADARTGRIVKKLASAESDLHFDALSFLESAGAWSPDARKLAFIVFAQGDNELAILDVESRQVERRLRIRGVGALSTPSWSPDGRSIAVSGNKGGITDLYLIDVATGEATQLTDDRYAELQPAWSPDGRTLAFISDRGPETDFELLTYAPMRVYTMDVPTRRIEPVELFPDGKHIDPSFSPDGRSLYFISDADGFSDVYRAELASGRIHRVTRLVTGASGFTALSPALTVAAQTGDIMFSVFSEGNYAVYRMDAPQAQGTPVEGAFAALEPAGVLPPLAAANRGIVANYMDDPRTGLPVAAADEWEVTEYRPDLSLDYLGVPQLGATIGGPFGTAIQGAVSGYFSDMLGHRSLGVAVQANGGIKDVGGQVVWQNRRHQWNYGLLAGHIPYQTLFLSRCLDCPTVRNGQPLNSTLLLSRFRIFFDQAMAVVDYPFSQTRRFEGAAGYMHLGFDLEQDSLFFTTSGQQIAARGTEVDIGLEGISVGTASAALVGDWSFFGFTSPVRGGRYRLEVSPTFGDLQYQTGLADYRRYFFSYPFTLALRGLHYGRYGRDADADRERGSQQFLLQPLFLGYETLVRGYALESFSLAECVTEDCVVFDRLLGSKLVVANAEVRVPLFGGGEFGLVDFPFLPTELAAFVDAGVAWRDAERPELTWATRSTERIPVVSTGVSARMNLFGYMVLEIYYAHPFQRPDKGSHFGFQLAPGW